MLRNEKFSSAGVYRHEGNALNSVMWILMSLICVAMYDLKFILSETI